MWVQDPSPRLRQGVCLAPYPFRISVWPLHLIGLTLVCYGITGYEPTKKGHSSGGPSEKCGKTGSSIQTCGAALSAALNHHSLHHSPLLPHLTPTPTTSPRLLLSPRTLPHTKPLKSDGEGALRSHSTLALGGGYPGGPRNSTCTWCFFQFSIVLSSL